MVNVWIGSHLRRTERTWQVGPVKFGNGAVDKKKEPRQILGGTGDLKPADGGGVRAAGKELGGESDHLPIGGHGSLDRVGVQIRQQLSMRPAKGFSEATGAT